MSVQTGTSPLDHSSDGIDQPLAHAAKPRIQDGNLNNLRAELSLGLSVRILLTPINQTAFGQAWQKRSATIKVLMIISAVDFYIRANMQWLGPGGGEMRYA